MGLILRKVIISITYLFLIRKLKIKLPRAWFWFEFCIWLCPVFCEQSSYALFCITKWCIIYQYLAVGRRPCRFSTTHRCSGFREGKHWLKTLHLVGWHNQRCIKQWCSASNEVCSIVRSLLSNCLLQHKEYGGQTPDLKVFWSIQLQGNRPHYISCPVQGQVNPSISSKSIYVKDFPCPSEVLPPLLCLISYILYNFLIGRHLHFPTTSLGPVSSKGLQWTWTSCLKCTSSVTVPGDVT